jgi:hypothetical protein
MNTRACFASCLLTALLCPATASAAEFPQSFNVELQPLKAQIQRVVEAMDYLGFPLPDDNEHSPNEKFNFTCFRKGMAMSALLWEELGKV